MCILGGRGHWGLETRSYLLFYQQQRFVCVLGTLGARTSPLQSCQKPVTLVCVGFWREWTLGLETHLDSATKNSTFCGFH